MVRSNVWSTEGSVRTSEFKWDGALWKGLEPEEGKGDVFQPSPLKERKGVSWRPRARQGKRSHGGSPDNGPGFAVGEQAHSGKRQNKKQLIRQIWGRRVKRVRSRASELPLDPAPA